MMRYIHLAVLTFCWCTIHFVNNTNAFILLRSFALSPLGDYPLHMRSSGLEDDVKIYHIDTPQISMNSSQSLLPDIAYYYLQNTIGLSEETMWKITLEAGSILGMTPRNLEKKVALLRRTMDLSHEDMREMLRKQPAVLQYSADRNLAPTILLLVRALDFSRSELRNILMCCPSILGYSSENLKKKLSFFMDTLGYNNGGEKDGGKSKVRELLLREPRLLSCGVKSGLVPRMHFLHREIQFPFHELRLLYQKNPKLLLYSLDSNLREKIVFFFILQLQMEPEHVRKVLITYPQVMDYNLENHMKPIAEYFTTELEFSAIEMRSIILRFPRLFTYSLFKVKHVVGFLRYELALDAQQVKRVIFQAPQIIGLDTEKNMKEKLNFLQQRVRLNQQELAIFIAKMPTVFSLNVETSLIPKLDYLESVFNDTNEMKKALCKQPVLLGYSLERIQTRMKYLIQAGIASCKITVGISMSDYAFQKWIHSSRSKLDTSQWSSKAAVYLCNSLNFTDNEIGDMMSRMPLFPKSSVKRMQSHISYLERIFEDEDLKYVIFRCPSLIDVSLKKNMRRRIDRLRIVQLPLLDNIDRLYWNNDEFDAIIKGAKSGIKFITNQLRLNSTEAHLMLSCYPELESTSGKKGLDVKVKYLLAHFNDLEMTKSLLLCHPKILDIRLSTLKMRLEEMRQSNISDLQIIGEMLLVENPEFKVWLPQIKILTKHEYEASEILQILSIHPKEAEKNFLKYYLCKRIYLNKRDACKIASAVFTKRCSMTRSLQNLEYLLLEAFDNSTESLKQALVSNSAMLKKSLNDTIIPRVENMKYLKSVGFEYTPDEVGKLLSVSHTKYEQSVVPVLITWGESNIDMKGKFSDDTIRTALQEYVPSLVFAHSQDFNREDAKIVHWKQ